LPSRPCADFLRGVIQDFLSPPADVRVGAMGGETDGHLLAKPGPPARNQYALSLERRGVEHW
jgi:hypothetical protein